MLNFANEKLVQEGFINLGAQVKNLAEVETEDMRNITLNFLALKEQLDNEIKERKAQAAELSTVHVMKNQALSIIEVMKEFEEFKLNMIEALKETKEERERKRISEVQCISGPEVKKEIVIKEETTKEPEIKEPQEQYEVHCIKCEKKQKINNPQLTTLQGRKTIEGTCVCGGKLFKLL